MGAKKINIPWNKGLTKETSDSMMRISEQRKGTGNPMSGKKAWNRGKKWSKEHKQKLSIIHTGKEGFWKGKKLSDDHKKKLSESHKGQIAWNFQNHKSRQPYGVGWSKKLKDSIRDRDGYQCQCCGLPEEKHNGNLVVHHKNEIKTDLNPDNLITLCRSCHTSLHHQLLKEKIAS